MTNNINGYGIASVLRAMSETEYKQGKQIDKERKHSVKTLEELRDFSIDLGIHYGMSVAYKNAAIIIERMMEGESVPTKRDGRCDECGGDFAGGLRGCQCL